jgi:cytochrome c oxidase assembly protein subunit 15
MSAVNNIATVRIEGHPAASTGAVRVWLWAVAALIFAMVLVGGATRLTESGLSITQWKPITGVIPPLSAADWQAEFDRYKLIPQYSRHFPDMDVDGFKTIFLWEWSHRLLARVIGLAFILPALWFWRIGALKGALGRQVLAAACLLALEPIVGWWMVASGLVDRTEVSQVRLAIHLLIGAATFSALVYAATGLRAPRAESASARLVVAARLIAVAVFCQLGLGALVAGLRAGLIYNTWPLMDGSIFPKDLFGASPWWSNLTNDIATVQFDHRLAAYIVVALALWHAVDASRIAEGTSLARRARIVAGLALTQAALGIAALLLVVPIWAGLLHQAFAMLLLGMAVVHARASALDARPP